MTTTTSLKNAMNSVANSARHSAQCISTQASALGRSFKSMDLKNTMIETYQNTDMTTRKAVLCTAGIAVIAAAALSMQSAPVLPVDPSANHPVNASAVNVTGHNASEPNPFNASLFSSGSNESKIAKKQNKLNISNDDKPAVILPLDIKLTSNPTPTLINTFGAVAGVGLIALALFLGAKKISP